MYRSSLLIILKPGNQQLYYKQIISKRIYHGFWSSFQSSPTIFYNCKNILNLQNILHGCLWNRNKDRQEILITKKISYINLKRQCSQYVSVHYHFFQCVFDYSGWSSREFISNQINCKQISLPLTRRNISLLQSRFVFAFRWFEFVFQRMDLYS